MTGETLATGTRQTDQVHLSRAPLSRVLCQVSWQKLTKFDLKQASRDIAELIGDSYPFSDERQEAVLTIGQAGIQQTPGGVLYRFQSADRTWAVTLGEVFLAVETSAYEGHHDFISRLGVVIDALGQVARIPGLQRIGYRYTNRIDDPQDMLELKSLFDPSILGGLAQGADLSAVVQTVTETVLRVDDSFLAVRSALLEPNATIDPSLPPVGRKSWLVDLDSFVESAATIPLSRVCEEAERLSAQASDHLFLSLVTKRFMERFK